MYTYNKNRIFQRYFFQKRTFKKIYVKMKKPKVFFLKDYFLFAKLYMEKIIVYTKF